MNKADLIDRIASGAGISKTQAASAIDTSVESITSALKKGDRVALIGFGTFSISQRKARNGRNPQTGATIKIAARRPQKNRIWRERTRDAPALGAQLLDRRLDEVLLF